MRYIRILFLVLFLALVWHPALAQPCGPPFPPCDPGAPVPIGGIEILIALGAVFGIKRLLNNRKKESQ
jgi:hypothetical protein